MPPLSELLRSRISRRSLLEISITLPLAACSPLIPATSTEIPSKPLEPAKPKEADTETLKPPTPTFIVQATPTLPPPPTAQPSKIIRKVEDIPEVATAVAKEQAAIAKEQAAKKPTPIEKMVTKDLPKPTPIPEKINAPELSIIWERQTETPIMSPKFSFLADESFIYASSGDRLLTSFKVTNGEQAWIWRQPRSLDYSYDYDRFDPSVLVATYGDNLWILNKATGQPKFNPIAYRNLKIGTESIQPYVFDKVIGFLHHIQNGEMTTAVDKSTGQKLWTIKGRILHTYPDTNLAVVSKLTGLSSLYFVDLETGKDIAQVVEQEKGDTLESYYERNSGHLIITNNNNYKISSVNFDNKEVAWSINEDKIKGYKTFVNKDPKDDNLYVKSKSYSQSGEKLTAINKKNGKVVWEIDLGKIQKQALQVLGIKEGVVIVKDSESFTTVLIDTKTGTRREVGKTQLNSIVGVHDNRVLVGIGGYDPHTYGVYGIDLTTGLELWRRAGQQHNSLYAAIAGGKVFFGKLGSEKLQVFGVNDGKLLKEFSTGDVSKIFSPRPDLVLVNGRKVYAIKA